MKVLSTILGIFSACYGTPILEWVENKLPSEMGGGSIAGYYNGIVYGLGPWYTDIETKPTWKIDLNTKKSESFNYPTPRDLYQEPATNAFATIDQYIYFLANNGGSNSSSTLLSAFSMKSTNGKNNYDWKVWPDGSNTHEIINGRSYEVLPCVTSTIDDKFLIIMGGQINGKESAEVIFIEIDDPTQWMYGPNLLYPSSKFGCIAAHDGYLYKFGGSNANDPAQGWKLNISDMARIKAQNWTKIDIDLGVKQLENPTVLELERDELLYIIGGYDVSSGSCVKTVTFLNITDDKNVHDPDYIVPQLIDGYCYGAGVSANHQFYLFGGSKYDKGTKTADAVAVWQQTINNTTSPTLSPTPSPTLSPPPTKSPTKEPTTDPTSDPTAEPTDEPTTDPTAKPTVSPTKEPTTDPTSKPTGSPTKEPTTDPTSKPTGSPTKEPTTDPTAKPTGAPTAEPTTDPTSKPTGAPTKEPTTDPTTRPTGSPTKEPTSDPTSDPTSKPTGAPTKEPTTDPTNQPTLRPSTSPTMEPTADPTTDKPSASPTITPPKSSGDGPSTNWIIVFSLIGCAALLIVVSCSVYCVKRYKSRVGRQEEQLLQIM